MTEAACAAAVNVLLFFKPLDDDDDDDDDDVENGREQSGDVVDERDARLNTAFVFDDEAEHSNEDKSRRVLLSREAARREKARVVCISLSFQVRLCRMNNEDISKSASLGSTLTRTCFDGTNLFIYLFLSRKGVYMVSSSSPSSSSMPILMPSSSMIALSSSARAA